MKNSGVERLCATCGNRFLPLDKRRKYCGPACFHGAFRAGVKPTERACGRCGIIKPFDAKHFAVRARSPWGLETICRTCTATKARVANKPGREAVRLAALTHYSVGDLKCACCGERHYEFLTLDHVNGDGAAERKRPRTRTVYYYVRRSGFQAGYRVLCMNCNFAIGVYGHCPHQKELGVDRV